MPNPRDRIKFTGDTRLPDVGEDVGADEDVLRFEPVTPDDEEGGRAMPQRQRMMASSSRMASGDILDRVREEVRTRPVRALGGAFALGVLLAWF